MANLKNVVQLTYSEWSQLMGSGTVSGYTWNANDIYLVDRDGWHTVALNSTSGVPTGMSVACWYQVGLFKSGSTGGGFMDLGVVYTSGGTSNQPLVLTGFERTSGSNYGNILILKLYYSGSTYYGLAQYGSNSSSFTTTTDCYLRFRRVNI